MAYQREEDLFKDSTMTFGEHLEELRSCLVKALLGLLVGVAFGLALGGRMVEVIQGPLQASLETYYENQSVRDYKAFAAEQEESGLPLPYSVEDVTRLIEQEGFIYQKYLVHPQALRRQLGIDPPLAAGADQEDSATQSDAPAPDGDAKDTKTDQPQTQLGALQPMFVWQKVNDDARISISALGPTEAFMIWLKACLVVGAILASPWIFYQLWSFVAAGLYPNEKKYVTVFLPFSVILFLTGALFCFFVVFPFILNFLFQFNADLGIAPTPRISEWVSFAIILPLGFGISFQLPLVMLFLERIGIFDVPAYLAKWRIAVLVIFVLSMFLTPADPLSMIAMAVPLTALYFGGIALCHYMPKQKGMLDH